MRDARSAGEAQEEDAMIGDNIWTVGSALGAGHDWVVLEDGFQIGIFYERDAAIKACAAVNGLRAKVVTSSSNTTERT